MRHIRTAGKGSGSIELTLPADLRSLVGLPCRIWLRDGSRPDIVLQPDLRPAHAAFVAFWSAMAAVLPGATPASLPMAVFAFGLQPREGGGERPFLCWRDGLALAAPTPPPPLAVARTIAGFGHAMAPSLHIAPTLASGFGAACGLLVGGVVAYADEQEACDLAAALLRREAGGGDPAMISPALDTHATGASATTDPVGGGDAPATAGRCLPETYASSQTGSSGMAAGFWHAAAPLLIALAEIFARWTADPAALAELRTAWRHGRAIEMSGG